MITQGQAERLLNLPKQIVQDESIKDKMIYAPSLPFNDKLYLVSKEDNEVSFFIDIFQSSKNQIKLTLHCQEDGINVGLLRVDFNGRHLNPDIANEKVPDIFKPFAGKWIEESHIHYFIEGYKPLAWALPLVKDKTFPVKDFTDNNEFGKVLKAFGNKINLQTMLTINIQTELL